MLPSARTYLRRAGYSQQAAGLILMACFVAGWLGIQAVSRLLHKFMPSHVVDCNHSHAADDDEESHLEHERRAGGGDFHRDPRALDRQQSSSSSGSLKLYDQGQPNGMVNESSPLLGADRDRSRPSGFLRQWSSRGDLLGSTKRPSISSLRRASMFQVQQHVVSFVKDTKANCDEDGPCYGYSDPCGHECFKHLKNRRYRPSSATTVTSTVTSSTLTATAFAGFSEDLTDEAAVSPTQTFSNNRRVRRVISRDGGGQPTSDMSQDESMLYRAAVTRPSVEGVHGSSSSAQSSPLLVDGTRHNRPASMARAKTTDIEAQPLHRPPTITEECDSSNGSLTSHSHSEHHSHHDHHDYHHHHHHSHHSHPHLDTMMSHSTQHHDHHDHHSNHLDTTMSNSTQHHHHVPANAFLSIGLQTSIAVAVHKFPEGFIMFATSHANPALGFAVFMALFVHNISEGFALALPLYMALGSRLRAVMWASLFGGFSQPIGAAVAALWFHVAHRAGGGGGKDHLEPNKAAYGCLFAGTAGIMACVAIRLFVEALALSHRAERTMAFAFFGMILMGLSSSLVA